jgi:putative SOS response-associated peptidase YedK
VARVCGRYVQSRGLDDLLSDFDAVDGTGSEPIPPDWNVAPTKPVPVLLTRHRAGAGGGPVLRQVRVARWGLVPSWSPDITGAARKINARVETVRELPAFRSALARRRCLVPADGWYEWARTEDGRKQPYYLTAPGGLAFAGLYEFWGAERMLSTAIVTTAAVGRFTGVHDRMPLVLPRAAWAGWLDPGRAEPELAPPPAGLLDRIEVRPVGAAVGNVTNAGPGLVAAAPVAEPQTLF